MGRWLARDPHRRADPRAFLPEALTVVSLGVGYFGGPVPPPPSVPAGRVARYAWGEDYHDVLMRRLEAFQRALSDEMPGLIARSAVDASPLLERAFARRGGLGFVGKNTNLIIPGAGSWFFLTEMLINAPLPEDAPVRQGCGSCARCGTACPTGALDVPFQLDARKCVAYHTIENRGDIPEGLRPGVGSWVFGCDDCQDPCPFNARPLSSRWPEFSPERGAGAWVPLADLLSMRTNEAFRERFSGTPLMRAKRAGLVRNACVVARNTGVVEELKPLLIACRDRDESPVVRSHAAWALSSVSS
jgi:epoxyqueuosine reductase